MKESDVCCIQTVLAGDRRYRVYHDYKEFISKDGCKGRKCMSCGFVDWTHKRY